MAKSTDGDGLPLGRFRKPRSYIFRGVVYRKIPYKILWRHPRGHPNKVGGTCDSPNADNRAIEISPKLKGESRLRVILDESLHASLWPLDNDFVGQISTSLAEFLWQCGVRFKDE